MKKLLIGLGSILFLSIIFLGCREDEKDIEVVNTSAELQKDGSVIVRASLNNRGEQVKYAGFCMDTIPVPTITSNQKGGYAKTDNFEVQYRNLLPYKKYYFRPFVSNANGYLFGDVVAIDKPKADFSNIDCQITLDSFSLIGDGSPIYDKIYYIYPFEDNIASGTRMVASTYNYGKDIEIVFTETPIQGEFTSYKTTIVGYDTTKNYVKVLIDGYQIEADQKLYIEMLEKDSYEVRLCNAQLFRGSGKSRVSFRFRCKK